MVQLYAPVMRFLHQAIVWYKQGQLMYSVSSLIKPWTLAYEETSEAIKDDSNPPRQTVRYGYKVRAERYTHLLFRSSEQGKDQVKAKSELNSQKFVFFSLVNYEFELAVDRLERSITSKPQDEFSYEKPKKPRPTTPFSLRFYLTLTQIATKNVFFPYFTLESPA